MSIDFPYKKENKKQDAHYECCTMALALNVVAGFLACLAFASALPALFPPEKTVVYKYSADVKAGAIEPAPFASQFALDGLLHVTHITKKPPSLTNDYRIVLTDLKYALNNGRIVHHEQPPLFLPIPDNAITLQTPFLVLFDINGTLEGIKFTENESGWSRNIKQAIASMLQLDLASMTLTGPLKPHGFLTKENTIHGECTVAYDVHTTDQLGANEFVVVKHHEPKSCTEFVTNVFDNVESDKCFVDLEDPMTTASRRYFEIENYEQHILIKKLNGYGVINYFPWHAKSEAHYLLTNQTLILEKVVSEPVIRLPEVDFEKLEIIRDISFRKPQGSYALYAAEDLTQGRHVVDLPALILKVEKMLGEAADYLVEDHLDIKEPELKHGQTINRLLDAMTLLDLGTLERVFTDIQDGATPREVTIRNVFLKAVPHVGTTASSLFIRNVIRKQKVTDVTAISILGVLPFNLRVPSEKLLSEMEDLLNFGDKVHLEVRKASILCFATMIYKTFKHGNYEIVNERLNKYVQHLFDRVKSEPNYEMKMVYMQALQNVEVGGIHKLLEPIIRGDLMLSEKPNHLRVLAIMAAWRPVIRDIEYVHDLYWPLLTDAKLPLDLRVAAYTVLVNQPPNMRRLMNLYWFMVYEKNEHLYNYHYTTMRSLSNTMNPCLLPVKEMARKILRFIRVRPVSGILTGNYLFDYEDQDYGHGEMMRTKLVANEHTGLVTSGLIDYISIAMRKPVNKWSFYWRLEGIDNVVSKAFMAPGSSIHEAVVNALKNAAQVMPSVQEIHVELSFMSQGRVILTKHYNEHNLNQAIADMDLFNRLKTDFKANWQHIMYDVMYEMQVPTDLGLPATLMTRAPSVMSVKTNRTSSVEKSTITMKVETDIRLWSHGFYSMYIYNPIVNVWHDIRRVFSHDIVLPVAMGIEYKLDTQILKVTLPRLPLTHYSKTGLLSHVKNSVGITNDEHDLLKQFCETCLHHEVVSKGKAHRKNLTIWDHDVKDTGLKHLVSIFDCERSLSHKSRYDVWESVYNKKNKNTWNNPIVYGIMALRHSYRNILISPHIGSCGYLAKTEPSLVYPTSRVDIVLRFKIEDVDPKPLHLLAGKQINVHGTLAAIAEKSETTVRSWDLNANIDISPGHNDNIMKIQMTRATPGEKNLKICIDGQKIYPKTGVDLLNTTLTKVETFGTLNFTMGYTPYLQCVRDEVSISVTMKGEHSEEQKELYIHDKTHGMCSKDMKNPNYTVGYELVPRTHACLHAAIAQGTPRNYIYDVLYTNLTENLSTMFHDAEHWLLDRFSAYHKWIQSHVEPGTTKVEAVYPVLTREINVTVVKPIHGYKLIGPPCGDPEWNWMMDNTQFSLSSLQYMKLGYAKFCSIYPEIVTGMNNVTIPIKLPNEWTIASGDYVNHQFAVLVKNVGDRKIGMKVIIHDHELEVMPTESGPKVTVDAQPIENHQDGLVVGVTENKRYTFRMTWHRHIMLVHSQHFPIYVEWTPSTVTMGLGAPHWSKTTGICSHMNMTHMEHLLNLYKVEL